MRKKINMKPYFILWVTDRLTVKVNYILDAQNNGKNYLILSLKTDGKSDQKHQRYKEKMLKL